MSRALSGLKLNEYRMWVSTTIKSRQSRAPAAAFRPEGQHDSSQVRNAWNHEENSPVPAGGLKPFNNCTTLAGAQSRRQKSGGLTLPSPAPPGGGRLSASPRHS